MNVLVVGAGGYIGIPLCEELAKRGHAVHGTDRFYFGKYPSSSCSWNHGDIRNCPIDGETDVVIDLAGLSNDAAADIDEALTIGINLTGAMKLSAAAKRAGVKKYIYSSSCSVYGHGERSHLNEMDDTNPLTAYARSKVGVEDYLRSLASPTFDPIILRNATVFGVAPRMRFDLAVNIMTLRAWRDGLIYIMGSGKQYRPFVHVLDVVRAFVLALEHDAYLNETFNVGSDLMNYSIDGLAWLVRNVFPSAQIHQIPDDPDRRSYHCSFLKIRETMQFKTHHDITSGICEVRQALIDGAISGDDPTCYTTSWYRSLLEWDKRLADIRLDGKIL